MGRTIAATVPLWWALPLVGGGEHDWAILLDQWGWLERDQALGLAVFLLGVALYGTALVAGWVLLNPRPAR